MTDQRIKGTVQKLSGDIKMKTGKPISGTVDRIKGKANDVMGDVPMKTTPDMKNYWED